MAIFKEFKQGDIKTARSFLNQLVDVIQEDISGSTTRRKMLTYVTGGIGPGVTSSLFQTVYDQDFSLQTANPVLDLTVGIFSGSSTHTDTATGVDSTGKQLFPETSLMMREKLDIYRQFAQTLLGDATSRFIAPFNSTATADQIDEAMFICFRRLFHRDQIRRETFALRFFESASFGSGSNIAGVGPGHYNDPSGPEANLNITTESGSVIYTDVGSATNKLVTFGGQVSNIVDSANTARTVGLLFNDRGIVVLDLAKIISGSQHVSGTIDAMNATAAAGFQAGQIDIGGPDRSGNSRAKFIPDFLTSGSIDNIIDHFASTRFSSGTETAATFQNITNINSTLFFARSTADEFNYSANPTYVDSNNRIVVIDEGQEDTQRSFCFITSIGLYDLNNNLLAVAKTSRPIEKNDEKDMTLRVRLDF